MKQPKSFSLPLNKYFQSNLNKSGKAMELVSHHMDAA
jgi:hypothetical protein